MRLVKKPTAVSDSTATSRASNNTESSPDFKSRQRLRNAKRSACISLPRRALAAWPFTVWPASSSSIRLQRFASPRSCVTSTKVLRELRFKSNKRSVMRCPVAVSKLPVGSSANRTCRMRHESARNGDALLFAAGQLLRIVRHPRRQPHLRERGRGRLARVAPAAEFQRQHDIFDRRQ